MQSSAADRISRLTSHLQTGEPAKVVEQEDTAAPEGVCSFEPGRLLLNQVCGDSPGVFWEGGHFSDGAVRPAVSIHFY